MFWAKKLTIEVNAEIESEEVDNGGNLTPLTKKRFGAEQRLHRVRFHFFFFPTCANRKQSI